MKELIRIFEKRKADMTDMLLKQRETMDAAEQHQLYGAINEIELFVKTLTYYFDKSADDREVIRNSVTNEPNILDKWKKRLKDML